MRVLHLYAGNLYGGIERMLGTVARHAALEPRLEHEFGLCFDGQIAAELRGHAAKVHLLGEVRFSRPWTLWRARCRLAGLLARQRFDAVICHACWPHAVFSATVRRSGVRLLFWNHDAMSGTSRFDRIAARVPPDLVIANSHFAAQFVPDVFPGVPVDVIYGPISLEPSASAVEHPRSERAIVIACRFERWKGHALLLKALSVLRTRGTEFRLLVAGQPQRAAESSLLAELQTLARKSGVADRIEWSGHVDDMPSLFARAAVHCQPNTGPEPFGLAFVEALAAGVPVVTTRLGAAPEIVTPEVGELVEPDDPASLADALRRWLDRPVDPALSQRCRDRAAALCDPARQLGRIHDHLAALCGSTVLSAREVQVA